MGCQSVVRFANTFVKIVNNTNTADPLEMTDKYPVMPVGAPSYTSGVHKWKGTSDILKNRPIEKNTKAMI